MTGCRKALQSPTDEGVATPPVLFYDVLPRYPWVAREFGVAGTVVVNAEVLTDSSVGIVTVVQSLQDAYDDFNHRQAARTVDDAVVFASRLCRYVPATWNGVPYVASVVRTYKFNLPDSLQNLDREPFIHGSVVDAEGDPVNGAGIHLIFDFLKALPRRRGAPKHRSKASTPNFRLDQNYPNPANPSTIIQYQIPSDDHVNLTVLDRAGFPVVTFLDHQQQAGFHARFWNGHLDGHRAIANGFFTVRLTAGGQTEEKPLCFNRDDPALLRTQNADPVLVTDAVGRFTLSYDKTHYGETIVRTGHTGPDPLDQWTVSNISLVVLKDGFQPLVVPMDIDTTRLELLGLTLTEE
jgi:hypothetical protein